ncbi:MAG: putative metal-binding motif-containing protein, partial [Fluviicola sp.]|nr:putative metal-binding motif-containing protein [Fluviicola sp.]
MTVSNCGPYTLNGITYFTSGTYTQVISNGNAVGCDSTINLNLSVVSSITYYADADGDGYGNPAVTQLGCSLPVGYVTNSDDCDDNNNMLGLPTTWYVDADNDGFGSATATTMVACTQPMGYVANSSDCDDANAAVNPNGTEIANNGIDEDCSGADLVITPSALG